VNKGQGEKTGGVKEEGDTGRGREAEYEASADQGRNHAEGEKYSSLIYQNERTLVGKEK